MIREAHGEACKSQILIVVMGDAIQTRVLVVDMKPPRFCVDRMAMAAAAAICVILVLSGFITAFPATAKAVPSSGGLSVEARLEHQSATPDGDQLAKCIFCGSSNCSGLDNLIWSDLDDIPDSPPRGAAVVPADVVPVFPRIVVRWPQSRAPPLPSAIFSAAFNPRGPPSVG